MIEIGKEVDREREPGYCIGRYIWDIISRPSLVNLDELRAKICAKLLNCIQLRSGRNLFEDS